MKTSEKRKSRGGDFRVPIGTSVPSTAFNEIEALAKTLGTSKSGLARILLLRGLAEYQRDGKLTASVLTLDEVVTDTSDAQQSN